MPSLSLRLSVTAFSVSLACITPVAFAASSQSSAAAIVNPQSDFAVNIVQGGSKLQVPAKGDIYSVKREPLQFHVKAPARTVIFVNLQDFSTQGKTVFYASGLSLPTISSYGLISKNGWYQLPEAIKPSATGRVSPVTRRSRWVTYDIEGLMTEEGNNWKLGYYPFNDLRFTFAAVAVDATGKIQANKAVKYTTAAVRLGSMSDNDTCHMLQNTYRNIGEKPPSCEELLK